MAEASRDTLCSRCREDGISDRQISEIHIQDNKAQCSICHLIGSMVHLYQGASYTLKSAGEVYYVQPSDMVYRGTFPRVDTGLTDTVMRIGGMSDYMADMGVIAPVGEPDGLLSSPLSFKARIISPDQVNYDVLAMSLSDCDNLHSCTRRTGNLVLFPIRFIDCRTRLVVHGQIN